MLIVKFKNNISSLFSKKDEDDYPRYGPGYGEENGPRGRRNRRNSNYGENELNDYGTKRGDRRFSKNNSNYRSRGSNIVNSISSKKLPEEIIPGKIVEIDFSEYGKEGPLVPFQYRYPFEQDLKTGLLKTYFMNKTAKGSRFYKLYALNKESIDKSISDFQKYIIQIDSPEGEFISSLKALIGELEYEIGITEEEINNLEKKIENINSDKRNVSSKYIVILQNKKKKLYEQMTAAKAIQSDGLK